LHEAVAFAFAFALAVALAFAPFAFRFSLFAFPSRRDLHVLSTADTAGTPQPIHAFDPMYYFINTNPTPTESRI
jgi:hypothetical protein